MIATYLKCSSQVPVVIPTRVAATDVPAPCAGDFVTVHSIDGEVEFCIRLNAPAGPQCWRGAILSIGREGVPALVAQGLELEDVVEVYQSEMACIIRCQRIA